MPAGTGQSLHHVHAGNVKPRALLRTVLPFQTLAQLGLLRGHASGPIVGIFHAGGADEASLGYAEEPFANLARSCGAL